MATTIGSVGFSWGSYSLAYDLLSQSTANNTSTVRLYGILTVTNNYVSWSRGSASVHTSGLQAIGTYYARGTHTVITRDFTFGHDNNGNFSAGIGASLSTTYQSGNCSGTLTLPQIKRYAVTNSVSGSDIEGNFSVNFTKYVSSYVYKLRISIPNVVELQKINYQNSGTAFTLSQTTIENLFNRYSTSNTMTLGFAVETWNSAGTSRLSSGNEKKITCRIVNSNPVFNDFTFEDTNPIATALTGNNQNIITNYSNITATISTENKAEAIKGATMSKYRLVIGETSADINYSADSSVSVTINNINSGTFNMYAIDSRNNSTMITKLANNIINYENILIDKQNSSFKRDNEQLGENGILELNGTFWNGDFGNVVNTITSVTYRFKKTDSDTWINGTTTITPTITENNFTFKGQIASDNQDTTWDLQSSYNVEVTISDELSNATVSFTLNSGIPTLCLDKEGVGIMGAYDSSIGGYLQVGGERIDNVYSTDERKVGTWINNKPIYRKVITDTMNSGETTKTVNLNIDDSVDEYLMVDVRLIRSGTFNNTSYTTSGYNSSSDGFNWYFNTPQTKRVTVRGYSSHPVRPYNFAIIVEYTKTND